MSPGLVKYENQVSHETCHILDAGAVACWYMSLWIDTWNLAYSNNGHALIKIYMHLMGLSWYIASSVLPK